VVIGTARHAQDHDGPTPMRGRATEQGLIRHMLARARRESGDATGAEAALRQLLAIHSSTMDAVLVVEPARQKSPASATASVSK